MRLRTLIPLLLLPVVLWAAPTASACVLDNRSSLSANGIAAIKNYDYPSSGNLAGWAPFVFQWVSGRGDAVHFSENFGDLKKNLSQASLAHPFLWKWGDGTQSIGFSASHRYAHVGSYVVGVYAFDPTRPSGRSWLAFDRASLKIVPPGEVWRDNLGYEILDAVGFVLHWVYWLGIGTLMLFFAYGFWEDRRRRRTRAVSSVSPAEPV